MLRRWAERGDRAAGLALRSRSPDFHLQVHRQREEYRAGWRGKGRLHGAADGSRQIGEPIDLDSPLGPGPGHFDHRRPENRLFKRQPPIGLAGRDQQRRAFAVGVVEHAHGVAQPATDVQIDDAQRARGHAHSRRPWP